MFHFCQILSSEVIFSLPTSAPRILTLVLSIFQNPQYEIIILRCPYRYLKEVLETSIMFYLLHLKHLLLPESENETVFHQGLVFRPEIPPFTSYYLGLHKKVVTSPVPLLNSF